MFLSHPGSWEVLLALPSAGAAGHSADCPSQQSAGPTLGHCMVGSDHRGDAAKPRAGRAVIAGHFCCSRVVLVAVIVFSCGD